MARLRRLVAFALALPVLFEPCLGQKQRPLREPAFDSSPFTSSFSAFVDEVLQDWKVPGLSIAVIDGESTYAEGFGFATLPDIKATPETLWFGASTTKAFVAASLSQLIHESNGSTALKQGWSTPISSVIRDDFVLQDEWATNHLTLEDAVSHRTGLPRHDLSWAHALNGSVVPIKDVVRNLRHLPLTAAPRTLFQYCNLMYVVLSHVLETVTGGPLKNVLRDLIWRPLGMNSTYLDLLEANKSSHHLATGYAWNETAQRHVNVSFDTLQASSGAAGIISNVLDFTKWVRCLLYETAPLSNTTHRDIRFPRMVATTEPKVGMDVILYGLGWERTLFHGLVLYKHNGQSLSYGATVYWLPEIKYGVVSFGNIFLLSNFAQEVITRRLIEDKLRISDDERLDVAPRHKETLERERQEMSRADDLLYPDRPGHRIAPSVNATHLTGQYHHNGYGAISLRLEEKAGDRIVLLADRHDMVYQYTMRLEHVSGDFWTAKFLSANGSRLPFQWFKARFVIDIAGTVSSLQVTLSDDIPGAGNFTVVFDRRE